MKKQAYLKTGILPHIKVTRGELAKMLREARQIDGKATLLKYKDARGYQFRQGMNPYTYLIAI